VTPAEILRRARDLIKDPARWTTGAFARNANGGEVCADDPGACEWCALGAVFVSQRSEEDIEPASKARGLLAEAAEGFGFEGAGMLNDSTDHTTVLAMFDAAIARAEEATRC
jgi:hypothetical protein